VLEAEWLSTLDTWDNNEEEITFVYKRNEEKIKVHPCYLDKILPEHCMAIHLA